MLFDRRKDSGHQLYFVDSLVHSCQIYHIPSFSVHPPKPNFYFKFNL